MRFFGFAKREAPITPLVTDPLLSALLAESKITREMAVTLPAVAGAVDLIASAIASMPVRLYKRTGERVEALDNDRRVKMLNLDTGDTLDAFQMKHAMVEDYLLGGAGYCFIGRNRNEVTGLYYVRDDRVSVIKNWEPIYKDFTVLVLGQKYYPHQFVKLLRNTRDGSTGTGLVQEIGKTLETAYATLAYQLRMAKTGGARKGFLTSEKHLTQESVDLIQRAWKRMYTGETESTPVLNQGINFHEVNNTAVESQINETKASMTREINYLFHINDDPLETYKYAIYPVMKAFETALNRDLLLEVEKPDHFFAFDPKEALRVSIKERYESYKLAKETGFLTLNEIRAAENLDWVKGLDVVNVGLGAVLYDVDAGTYYTPNTDTKVLAGAENMLEAHVLTQEFDDSGNSAARETATLAVDYDNTIAFNGRSDPRIVRQLVNLQASGAKLILWTAREGADLADAVAQCEQLGLVFDEIAENKPDADWFIDDKAMTIDELEE